MRLRRERSGGRRVLIVAVVVVAAVLALNLLRVGPEPEIVIEPGLPGIGPRTPVQVEVTEPQRGLGGVEVALIQGERRVELARTMDEPRPFWSFWGPRRAVLMLSVEVGRETIEGLQAGEATIRVSAERAGTWLRRPAPTVRELTLPVRFTPPSLEVLSIQTYVRQGGSEAVVYRVGESAVEDGVRAGEWWFPGYPLPGHPQTTRFALFAVPYDMGEVDDVRVVARDELGNEAAARFIDRFTPHPPRQATIGLSEGFMAGVVPEIVSRSPEVENQGDLLASFLAVNGQLRAANDAFLRQLAAETRPELAWSEPFLQLPNSQVMAGFAERRTYLHDGSEVDRQYHLGIDLASTRRAVVPAANRGVVVHTGYLGIYGNTIVVDHGYGLMTLYAHLSSIDVAEGERVERGTPLGRTGETGLAGGDHLHFTVLLHGLPVDPIEWWDGRWIRHRLGGKLAPALPLE